MTWLTLLGFARRWWPYAAGAAVLVAGALWLRHAGYEAGWEDAQAEAQEARDAALAAAGDEFRRQLAERDAALAAAQGQVVEVVKWRVKTRTVYEEAIRTDPDCAAWNAEPVRCPLGLQIDAGPGRGPGVPADPGQPDG